MPVVDRAGFADQYEAIEAAQEAFAHVDGLEFVIQADEQTTNTKDAP